MLPFVCVGVELVTLVVTCVSVVELVTVGCTVVLVMLVLFVFVICIVVVWTVTFDVDNCGLAVVGCVVEDVIRVISL